MVQKYFVNIDLNILKRFRENQKLLYWYIALKDYAQRFKPDRYGYVRIPTDAITSDYGIDRTTAWRYNRHLEDKGYIKIDRKHRGGHTWMGVRFI